MSEPTTAATLAANVRRLRTAAGLTQTALAEAAGLSQSFVNEIERGERKASLATLDRLARALRVPTSQLLA